MFKSRFKRGISWVSWTVDTVTLASNCNRSTDSGIPTLHRLKSGMSQVTWTVDNVMLASNFTTGADS